MIGNVTNNVTTQKNLIFNLRRNIKCKYTQWCGKYSVCYFDDT